MLHSMDSQNFVLVQVTQNAEDGIDVLSSCVQGYGGSESISIPCEAGSLYHEKPYRSSGWQAGILIFFLSLGCAWSSLE